MAWQHTLQIDTSSSGVPWQATCFDARGQHPMPTAGVNETATENNIIMSFDDTGHFLFKDKFLTFASAEYGAITTKKYPTTANAMANIILYFDSDHGVSGISFQGFGSYETAETWTEKVVTIGQISSVSERVPIWFNQGDEQYTVNEYYCLATITLGDHSWIIVGVKDVDNTRMWLLRTDQMGLPNPIHRPTSFRRTGNLAGLCAAYIPFSYGMHTVLETNFNAAVANFKHFASTQFVSR